MARRSRTRLYEAAFLIGNNYRFELLDASPDKKYFISTSPNMKNHLFNTGICEATHSKRVIVNAFAGAKDFLGLAVLTVRGETLFRQVFDGAVTVDGCLCLTGADVGGVSLVEAYAGAQIGEEPVRTRVLFEGKGPSDQVSVDFMTLFRSFVEAAIVVRNETGSLPRLFINGIFFDVEDGSFTYLPPALADYLSSYLSEGKRRSVFFVAGGRAAERPSRRAASALADERFPGECAFARSCARFAYRFFAGEGESDESPVYFLGDRAPGFPRPLADLVWDAMRDERVDLESFRKALELSKQRLGTVTAGKPSGRVPLGKRGRFISLKHSVGRLFSSKWRLALLIFVLGGVMAYVFFDFTPGKGTQDRVSDLSPRSMVELYYSAMNRLDLDLVQSLLRRRAGRKAMNELSTLYVMAKLGQVYGGKYQAAGGTGLSDILSIQDLDIVQVADDVAPVFRARYKKTINTGDKKSEYLMGDTLLLQKLRDRWYIVNVESTILKESQRP
jgi:hypothetical protein